MLTVLGNTFTSRVAASLLNAIGLPELIAATHADYERTALDLARDGARLSSIRAKLAAHRLTHPLFNADSYTRHLEAACAAMWERHRQGQAPGPITIGP